MLEKAFNRAHEIKSRQRALSAEQGARDGKTEKAFFDAILFQRDQVMSPCYICQSGTKRLLDGFT